MHAWMQPQTIANSVVNSHKIIYFKYNNTFRCKLSDDLFHHPYHQWAEKVNFRAETVFLLPGTSSGQ